MVFQGPRAEGFLGGEVTPRSRCVKIELFEKYQEVLDKIKDR